MNLTNAYTQEFENMMALHFSLVELNLFLDTHPDDRQALKDYNEMTEKYQAAKKLYLQKYGPLINFGDSKSEFPWQWVNNPWPWDM